MPEGSPLSPEEELGFLCEMHGFIAFLDIDKSITLMRKTYSFECVEQALLFLRNYENLSDDYDREFLE